MVTKLFEHPQEVKGEALLTSPEKKKKQNIMASFLAFIKDNKKLVWLFQ